jgi:hypothetical protein
VGVGVGSSPVLDLLELAPIALDILLVARGLRLQPLLELDHHRAQLVVLVHPPPELGVKGGGLLLEGGALAAERLQLHLILHPLGGVRLLQRHLHLLAIDGQGARDLLLPAELLLRHAAAHLRDAVEMQSRRREWQVVRGLRRTPSSSKRFLQLTTADYSPRVP